MNAEQAALDLGVRSWAEKRSDDWRTSLSEQAKTTGIGAARVGDPDGHELAVRTIRRLVSEYGTVTADDVQRETPIRSNSIGSAFAALSRSGEIRVIGYTSAKAPQAHGRLVRVLGSPVTHESPVQDRASADARDVEAKSTGTGGQDGVAAWGKVPRNLATMNLSKNAMRAFIVLSSFANGGSRAAWPTQDTLARELGWITPSTGKTDRYRIARAIRELVAAGVVRRDRRQSLGGHAWSWRFLVAPFPEDASPSDASPWMSPSDDASVSALTMRAFQPEDASPSDAQTDLRNRPKTDQGIAANEKHEEQEPELGPDQRGSLASFNHDRPRWRHATQSEEARDEPA